MHVERDGQSGLAAARRLQPVAIVLDVGLPEMEGTEVCRRLRADGDWTPVLFVTARDDEVDRILGLELGADDYVTKPFSPRELVARVVPSCGAPAASPAGRRCASARSPRPRGRDASPPTDGAEIALTATEFDLLAHLLRQPGRVFTREQLLAEVWGYSAAAGTRTVDVHVAQVRGKLGADGDLIRTVRGVGYAAQEPSL